MWRAAMTGIGVIAGAAAGLITAFLTTHFTWGLAVGLIAVVVLQAGIQAYYSRPERRPLPSDRAHLGVIRQTAEQFRKQELTAVRDGATWPAVPAAEADRFGTAVNALASRPLTRLWYGYADAAQRHARLVRGGRTPPAAAELNARAESDRAYDRLMTMLRRMEER